MSVFSHTEARPQGGDIDLTVPQGRAWKIMAVGIHSLPADGPIYMTWSLNAAQSSVHEQIFSSNTHVMMASIGATPQVPDPSDPSKDLDGPVTSLPDIRLPSGTIVSFGRLNPPGGAWHVDLIIED